MSSAEAAARLRRYGPNRLVPERHRAAFLVWLLRPFTDPMAILLLVAGGTYFAVGDRVDAIIVIVALVPITLTTLVLEMRSERALERLKQLTAATVAVWRDGVRQTIPAEDLVPGDLFFLQEGDVVPADGAMIQGAQLSVDESSLTGESLPVEKAAATGAASAGDATLLFGGTTVLAGRALGRVTATGGETRYGRIGALMAGIRQPRTPLEHVVRKLVLQLGVVAGVLCVAVGAVELLLHGEGWDVAIIAGISLGIAAVPEEFPMVYTLYLTLGAWRLARNNALVRRLAGVETLGSTSVICTDKTGTLTLGNLEIERCVVADGRKFRRGEALGPEARDLLEAAVLASERAPYDALEQAILRFAASEGMDVDRLHGAELVGDYPFDPAHKYMSHVWERGGLHTVCAKGALEGILLHSHAPDDLRDRMIAANTELAGSGMRVIAIACGDLPGGSAGREHDESVLRLVGLLAFSDPLRPGVKEALEECGQAGIRVIMITGDHPETGHAVADSLGLPHDHGSHLATGAQLAAADPDTVAALVRDVAIFARIHPEQKHQIVRALKAQGHIVAMTGDGINDAPALREADIGVAMGKRGTEVAREAATMVLLDDNFATIVRAVRNGRRIFDNLRTAFSYLVAFHVPLLLSALVVPLMGAPLLLMPVHLIWLELVVHPTASLVFEADAGARDLMRRRPRSVKQAFLSKAGLARPLGEGVVLSAIVVALYLGRLASGAGEIEARSLGLATLILGQIGLVLAERSPDEPVWRKGVAGNRMLAWVVAGTLGSLFVALYVPPVAAMLHLGTLTLRDWGIAAAAGIAGSLWLEPVKALRRRDADEGR